MSKKTAGVESMNLCLKNSASRGLMFLCLKKAGGEEEKWTYVLMSKKKMAGVTENMCNFAVAIAGNSDNSRL